MERKLRLNPEFAEMYEKAIEDYLKNGHACLVPVERQNLEEKRSGIWIWYLPHHAVTNPNKLGKLRVVFDAAARTAGISLNDALLRGPDLLTNLAVILLRFRENRIAISADIEKMFNQVGVIKSDQPALRFFWRPPGDNNPPRTYQMTVQVFGASVARQVSLSLHRGGFRLTKWMSSSKVVLKAISKSECACPELNLDFDELPIERALGLKWHCEEDYFRFQFNPKGEVKTKRELLSTVASIFDPLGFVGPFLLTAKSILQDTWSLIIGWDDKLPEEILTRIQTWCQEIKLLSHFKIPRCLRTAHSLNLNAQLHVFSDASQLAFGAAVYGRFIHSDSQVTVNLIFAKSRLAPRRALCIPRLELQGAVLAVRIGTMVQKEMTLPFSAITFWTDAELVLKWIKSKTCKFHVVVANRVSEILEHSKKGQWRYVPTSENPADGCSRGLTGSVLVEPNHRWFRGPGFLYEDESNWPATSISRLEPSQDDPEVKWVGHQAVDSNRSVNDFINRARNLDLLKGTIAYVLRFIQALKGQRATKRDLTAPEINQAMNVCIRVTQEVAFSQETSNLRGDKPISANSRTSKLNPYLDEEGILRARGRFENSTLEPGVKNPVILPDDCPLSKLVIAQAHQRLHHSSVERTLHEIRLTYWILKGRKSILNCVARCPTCSWPPFLSIGFNLFFPLSRIRGLITLAHFT